MESNITQIDFNDIKSYKTKKLINTLKKLTDEQINTIVDSSVIEFISNLNDNIINSIFRNSNAIMQNKLWSNDKIQKILILGTLNLNNFVCTEQTIRNLENLNKVIKSQTIKEQIYSNKYFIYIIMNVKKIENRFFNSYDLKKIFDGMVQSEEFNSLTTDGQLRKIKKLNAYTNEVLLPTDFRKRYNNIDIILFGFNRNRIDNSIIEQLNREELFFLDYTSNSVDNNNAIRKYMLDNVVKNDKSFEEFFAEMKTRDEINRKKIQNQFGYKQFRAQVNLEEKIYHILLNENQEELIKEKLLKYLSSCVLISSFVNPEMMYNALKRNLNNGLISYRDISHLTGDDEVTKDLKLIFYLKFNIALSNARYLYGIAPEQLFKVNVKHINKLFKFLEDKTQDELSAIYGLCIKMCFIFGYERSTEILSGKFGKYDKKFFDNVAKTDITRVEMKAEGNKFLPVIDKRFINFMFETPKNNHFINMFNDKDSELYKKWYYLYNNYDELLEKCHNEITLKKINVILEAEKYDIDRKIITPDNYLLNDDSFLENIVLGNKTYNSNDEVLRKIVEIYSQMKKRIESSIPYVKGVSTDGYTYEVMKLDDPQIFELGYKADCCIRTCDIAHDHLLHAALCRNGRILIIYDKLGDVAAFSPLKRNGNVLIANSIECVYGAMVDWHLISTAFKEGVEEIVEVTKQGNEPINLVCMGSDSYLKPKTTPFPKDYPTPTIYEKNDEVYRDTDVYHKTLDVVYKDSDFDFKNIKSKNPDVSYMDPRDEIKFIDFFADEYNNNNENVINIINSINYSINPKNYIPINKYFIKSVYYSKDWYIAETHHGLIGEFLENDYRAREEFDSYMTMLSKEQQKILKKEL
ncbi:MAG: hypothetical protein V8Q71_01540 [Bacilli bacterium]